MAAGDKTIDPLTGEPEVELPDGSKVTDWAALKGVVPGGDATATARYKPNTDYVAGDPIFEPDPNDDELYVWRADADFRTGTEPEFDGEGFTKGAKVENPIGIENHIVQSDVTPRLFSGSGIGKALDIIQDGQLMPRAFRPALATQIYGSTGGGKIGTAVDPTNGLIYAVRVGRTVTDDTIPSLSSNWIQLYPGRVPPNAIADILQIRFDALVALTGLQLWSADTQELLMWDTSATPENVAPRKTYPAEAEPIPFVQGKWIVISPQPPGGEDSRIYTRVEDQAIPNANWNTYAVDLPDLEAGDEFTVVVARGALVYDMVGRFLSFGQQHEFVFAGTVWRIEVIGTQLRIQATSGGGSQAVKAIFVER